MRQNELKENTSPNFVSLDPTDIKPDCPLKKSVHAPSRLCVSDREVSPRRPFPWTAPNVECGSVAVGRLARRLAVGVQELL